MRQFLRHIAISTMLVTSLGLSMPVFAEKMICRQMMVLDNLFTSLQELDDQGDVSRIVAEIWTRWSTHPSEQSITARLNRGVAMMNQGDYVHAEGLFSDIIAEDPNFAEAWNKRATLYYIQGKFAESRYDIAQTLIREPRHFGALSGLGLIELSSGNYEAALRAYEQAAEVNPHMTQANEMIKTLNEKATWPRSLDLILIH